MPYTAKREKAGKRVKPDDATWLAVLERADYRCEWRDGDNICGLRENDIDTVGGGRVHLTSDHKRPHSLLADADRHDPDQWQALCGRHQVMKRNYWDDTTNRLNIYAIIQAASHEEKRRVLAFLLDYFGYEITKKHPEKG